MADGAGRIIDAGEGRRNDDGGETGRRWESHLLVSEGESLFRSPAGSFLRKKRTGPVQAHPPSLVLLDLKFEVYRVARLVRDLIVFDSRPFRHTVVTHLRAESER